MLSWCEFLRRKANESTPNHFLNTRKILGQGMVEFALALPVFLMLVFGVIEAGHLLMTYSAVYSAAREGARYGAAVGTSGNGMEYAKDCVGIRDAAVRVGSLGGVKSDSVIIQMFGADGLLKKDNSGATIGGDWCNHLDVATTLSDQIQVTVAVSYAPIVPIVPIPKLEVTGSGTSSTGGVRSSSSRTLVQDVASEGVLLPTATVTKFQLTVNKAGSGSVTPNVGLHEYMSGTSVPLSAAPDTCSTFTGWSGDITTANPAPSILIDRVKSVTANFETLYYPLSVGVDPSNGGTVSIGGGTQSGGLYSCGAHTLTANAKTNFFFDHWSNGSTTNPLLIDLSGPTSLTATFRSPAHNLAIQVNPPGAGVVTGAGNYMYGATVPITAAANPGYVFTGWTGGANPANNPNSSVILNSDMTVTANFSSGFILTMLTNGSGTTTPPNISSYPSGTTVAIQAVPATGWQFTGWSGALTGTANPSSILMNGNKSVTANFAKKPFTLTVSNNPMTPLLGGSVTPNTLGVSYYVGDAIQLMAAPSPGFQFDNWGSITNGSVTVLDNKNTTFTMSGEGNATIQANYHPVCAPSSLVIPNPGASDAIAMPNNTKTTTRTIENNSAYSITITNMTVSWDPTSETLISVGGSWTKTFTPGLNSGAVIDMTGIATIPPGGRQTIVLTFSGNLTHKSNQTATFNYSGICATP